MASLTNYLLTNRKRLALSQEEVAFLLGANGEGKGIKVSRNENSSRIPSLQTALAYEVIYGMPVRELFAGMYEQVEQEVAERARVLGYRLEGKPKPKRQEVITNLVSKIAAQSDDHE
jgi:transcriptional regulator with XRE-family HTH domain